MIIEVRAHAGRIAYNDAHGGRLIPQDKFIKAEMNAWLRRLRDVHGDVEIRRVERVVARPNEGSIAVQTNVAPAVVTVEKPKTTRKKNSK